MSENYDPSFLYEQEPDGWTKRSFDAFLTWMYDQGCSDFAVVPAGPFWVRKDGYWYPVTRRKVSGGETARLIDEITARTSTSSQIFGQKYKDFAYRIKVDRNNRYAFRISATACQEFGTNSGIEIVGRAISSEPPTMDDIKMPQEIREHIVPENGVVLITGTMGSGKSTTLAATMRYIIENQRRHVGTYEEPIEYDLMGIRNPMGPVIQTEIPTHLEDFTAAPRNAVRRAFDVVLIGELRDVETLRGVTTLGGQGPAVYGTVHVRNVPETVHQIINRFSPAEQPEIATKLISSLRLIVHQRLIPRPDGGRQLVKEYLPFTADVRARLMRCELTQLINQIEQEVSDHGVPLLEDARQSFEAGKIDQAYWDSIRREVEMRESHG